MTGLHTLEISGFVLLPHTRGGPPSSAGSLRSGRPLVCSSQSRVPGHGAFEYSPVHTLMYWVGSKRPPCCGK